VERLCRRSSIEAVREVLVDWRDSWAAVRRSTSDWEVESCFSRVVTRPEGEEGQSRYEKGDREGR
jgi:hypothetical protein